MTIDITPEAVEHLCAIHEGYEQHGTVATLRALSAALTASQAETAAAYEVAATYLENPTHQGIRPAWGVDIRALTPADSKAALDRMIADAEDRGMRKAAGIADNCVSMARESLAKADGIGERIAWRSAIARAQIIRNYILVAIPKGSE
jgi:hypothetical protein